MVQINMGEREITVKVVYYGPAKSGKTTNLQQLHQMIQADARGTMVTLDTTDDRTLYFDFLPIEFGTNSGFSIKIWTPCSAQAMPTGACRSVGTATIVPAGLTLASICE